jgi:hypothetical protein
MLNQVYSNHLQAQLHQGGNPHSHSHQHQHHHSHHHHQQQQHLSQRGFRDETIQQQHQQAQLMQQQQQLQEGRNSYGQQHPSRQQQQQQHLMQQQQLHMIQGNTDYPSIERDVKEDVKDRRTQGIDFRHLNNNNNNNNIEDEVRYSKDLITPAFQSAYSSRNDFFGYPQQELQTEMQHQEHYQHQHNLQQDHVHQDDSVQRHPQHHVNSQYLQQLYRQQLAAAAAVAVVAATATTGSAELISASKKNLQDVVGSDQIIQNYSKKDVSRQSQVNSAMKCKENDQKDEKQKNHRNVLLFYFYPERIY